jgi:hypothetical protein
MRIAKQVMTLCVVGSLLAVFASCVDSKYPLSDEKTSKIDEGLIGNWEYNGTWKVSKSRDVKNALEVMSPESTAPGLAFTTTIGSGHYLSLGDKIPTADAKKRVGQYNIYRYRITDKDTVEFRGMDSEVIEKAIAAKQLRGQIVDDEPVITDTPEAIAKYIEANADTCFPKPADKDEAAIIKRKK